MESLQEKVQKQLGGLIMELHAKDIEIERLTHLLAEAEAKLELHNGPKNT